MAGPAARRHHRSRQRLSISPLDTVFYHTHLTPRPGYSSGSLRRRASRRICPLFGKRRAATGLRDARFCLALSVEGYGFAAAPGVDRPLVRQLVQDVKIVTLPTKLAYHSADDPSTQKMGYPPNHGGYPVCRQAKLYFLSIVEMIIPAHTTTTKHK